MKKVLLIGGCGYAGDFLAKELSFSGDYVAVFDFIPPSSSLLSYSNVRYIKGDITHKDSIIYALESFHPDVIVHLASWGMSGSPMLSPSCRRINVDGTQLLIDVMLETEICLKLVYTSTYNVIYGGQPIINGDEKMPYFPLESHTDYYSRTKAEAEQLVISSNGLISKGIKKQELLTCALRPAAIYGEGEQRHFPRILQHMDTGIFQFRIGNATVDWVHIENLTLAFICAINKMSSVNNENNNNNNNNNTASSSLSSSAIPCGRVYFINDDTPIDNFEFLRPLCLSRGIPYPFIVIPTSFMLVLARFLEILYFTTGLEPFLTQAEVYKVGHSHFFSCDKAKNELGYKPRLTSLEGAQRVADYYSSPSLMNNKYFFKFASLFWYSLILSGLVLLFLVANKITFNNVILLSVQEFSLLLFKSHANLQLLFQLAIIIHIVEAMVATYVAIFYLKINSSRVIMWFMQTMILGGPSLQLLFQRLDYCKLKKIL